MKGIISQLVKQVYNYIHSSEKDMNLVLIYIKICLEYRKILFIMCICF